MAKIDSRAVGRALEEMSQSGVKNFKSPKQDVENQPSQSFTDHLKKAVLEVDHLNKAAEKISVDVATGKSGSIHEAMIANAHAELAFNFAVQVRNKALEAYQEIMRMPV